MGYLEKKVGSFYAGRNQLSQQVGIAVVDDIIGLGMAYAVKWAIPKISKWWGFKYTESGIISDVKAAYLADANFPVLLRPFLTDDVIKSGITSSRVCGTDTRYNLNKNWVGKTKQTNSGPCGGIPHFGTATWHYYLNGEKVAPTLKNKVLTAVNSCSGKGGTYDINSNSCVMPTTPVNPVTPVKPTVKPIMEMGMLGGGLKGLLIFLAAGSIVGIGYKIYQTVKSKGKKKK